MKLVFVHGFGGNQGGSMEVAIRDAADAAGVAFVPIRWDSGSLLNDATRTSFRVLAEAASDPNRLRGIARAVGTLSRDSSESWQRAMGATAEARVRVRKAIQHFGGASEDFCLLSFSLGCRVLLHALADYPAIPENLRCAAFVGAAAPRNLYAKLPRRYLVEGRERVVHVWSPNDDVLSFLYPLVQGPYPPAGLGPVGIPGIRDIELDVGHTRYAEVAVELVRAVTGFGPAS